MAVASFVAVNYAFNQIPEVPVSVDAKPVAGSREPTNWLIIGSDSRAGIAADTPFFNDGPDGVGGSRADVIIIVQLDPDRPGPVLLALPRDLLVDLPCDTFGDLNKINAALNGCDDPGDEATGEELMLETVRQVTGLDIHHYAEVDFAGFQAIIEAVGGIEYCFPYPARDNNSGLFVAEAGCQTLDGAQALAFVRSRHYEEEIETGQWVETSQGDLARINRQQQVLFALFGKLQGFSSVTNFRAIVNSVGDSLTIDSELGLTEAIDLAWDLRDLQAEDIVSVVPPTELGAYGELSVLFEVQPEAERLYAALRAGDPIPDVIDRSLINITLLNGSGRDDLAPIVAQQLAEAGFTVLGTDDATSPYTTTQVLRRPADAFAAQMVLAELQAGTIVDDAEVETSGNVLVILGADYPTVVPGAVRLDETTSTTGAP